MSTAFQIRCSHVLLDADSFISPGYVTCRDGTIVDVSQHCNGPVDLDLCDGLLMPGLINAHTHLEFSDLPIPFPPGVSFPQWIGSVLAHRRTGDAQSQAQRLQIAYQQGLAECLTSGTAVVADIVTPPWTPNLLAVPSATVDALLPKDLRSFLRSLSPASRASAARHLAPHHRAPHVIACYEQLGLTQDRMEASQTWLDERLSASHLSASSRLIGEAVSPHAPYSMHPELFTSAVRRAKQHRLPLVMHLAESAAEREWLDQNTGPFREMLERFQDGRPMQPPNLNQLIIQLAVAPRSLIIHGNYLRNNEIATIASVGKTMSVVYCPRTHQHFGHQAYPWEALNESGVRVVLGTDSRSTNPDLSIWKEAATVCKLYENVSPSRAFRAITSDAAEALGIADRFGSITINRLAAFAFLPMNHQGSSSQNVSMDNMLETAFYMNESPWHLSLISDEPA
ncbi:MAG: amidohydrolase family protein [Pirellulales bacterium]